MKLQFLRHRMCRIFGTEVLIHQSKVKLDDKILFRKITHLREPKIRKMLVRGLYGNLFAQITFIILLKLNSISQTDNILNLYFYAK